MTSFCQRIIWSKDSPKAHFGKTRLCRWRSRRSIEIETVRHVIGLRVPLVKRRQSECGFASFQASTFGGSTWSYHPPQQSQVTKTTTLDQSPPLTMAFTWSTVHCMPVVTFPIRPLPGSGGCSSNWPGARTQETLGSFPASASFANWSEVNLFLPSTPLRY